MKISTGFRLTANHIEFLGYIQESTGVDKTKTLEKLIKAEATKMAPTDSRVHQIMSKTPADYERDKENGVGIFAKK